MDRMIRQRILIFTCIFGSFFLFSPLAQAGCRNHKPICGNANICHSNRRSTNVHDLDQSIQSNLCSVLNQMQKKFGRIEILAAYRKNNASRGGAKNSVHLQKPGGPSMAVDVYRPANRRSMYMFLGGEKCRGIRYNIYCGTGTIHVDASPLLGRHLKDNYSGCRDFVRPTSCGGSDQVVKHPALERYKARPRKARRRCWQQKRWGSCCGPARKRHGYCTG